jgi:glycosyltransferase involved in cell wall biosynthesis
VRPGTTGLLVPPQRPELLAGAIAELAEDAAQRAAFGAAAREMAEAEYSDRQAARATVDLYERLVGP